MRPTVLNPLFSPARALPGVGEKTGRLFDRLLVDAGAEARVLDVLFHLPHGCVDRRSRPKIRDAQVDQIVTVEAVVAEHRPPPPRSRAPYRVLVEDEHGRPAARVLPRQSPVDREDAAAGRAALDLGQAGIVGRPSADGPSRQGAQRGGAGETARRWSLCTDSPKASTSAMCSARWTALSRACPNLPEWLDPAYQRQRKWPARMRLAYDELLANQLALVMVRARMKVLGGRASAGDGRFARKIMAGPALFADGRAGERA
jgi:ATP-dependent DNA helicase RecG